MKPVVLNTGSRNETYKGLTVLHKPLIKICALPLDETIRAQYDWLIFTSKNAVTLFFEMYPYIKYKQVAAIGTKTEEALSNLNIKVDYVPSRFQQEYFLEDMDTRFQDKTVCLPVSKKARPLMFETLKNIATVDKIELYEPQPHLDNVMCVHQMIRSRTIDWILFLSPSSVHAYFQHFSLSEDIRVMAIGQVTSEALQKYNVSHVISEQETLYAMYETIKKLN